MPKPRTIRGLFFECKEAMKTTAIDIDELNDLFARLSPSERMEELYKLFSPEEILLTSSFGTTSALLLHHVHRCCPEQTVFFIDTRFLFPETIQYKELLASKLQLNVQSLKADESGYKYARDNALWESEPDICCGINKTMPVEEVRGNYKVWLAGLLGHQNQFRENLKFFEMKGGTLRCYPLLDMDAEQVKAYFEAHDLPRHPLESRGYGSVGCVQCTVKGQGRAGRWIGKFKTECGLHKG